MTDPCVTEAMIEAGVHALMQYPDRQEIDIPAAVRDVLEAAMHSSRPVVEDGLVERLVTDDRIIGIINVITDLSDVNALDHAYPEIHGRLTDLVTEALTTQASELVALKGEMETLRAALEKLEKAEAAYRYAHDILGGGDPKTGRAWDLMKRAGDGARQALTVSPEKPA